MGDLVTDGLACEKAANDVLAAGGTHQDAADAWNKCMALKGHTQPGTSARDFFLQFITSAIGLFTGAGDAANSATQQAATSGIYSAISETDKLIQSTASDLVSSLDSTIGQSTDTLKTGQNTILDKLNGILSGVASLGNSTFVKILESITKAIDTTKSLQAILDRDLSAGISGILQVPKDLAAALGSFDGIFKRAIGLQQDRADARIKDILNPEIGKVPKELNEHLTQVFGLLPDVAELHGVFSRSDSITKYLSGKQFTCEAFKQGYSGGAFKIDIPELQNAADIDPATLKTHIDEAEKALGDVHNYTSAEGAAVLLGAATKMVQYGWEYIAKQSTAKNSTVSMLLQGLLALLLKIEVTTATLASTIKVAEQGAHRALPVTLLDPATTIEAWRRGLLNADDACYELASQGFDPTRQQVLYDVAQFLFGPRDAVELLTRGIIQREDFQTLMDQNNVSEDQARSLIELMNELPSIGDYFRAYQRGIIDELQFAEQNKAHRVSDFTRDLLLSVIVPAPSARVRTRLQGRLTARGEGFLGVTLNTEPPPDVRDTYTKNILSQGEADQDWLAHWNIPPPEWWIDAWFRGLIDRETVLKAFDAENIPREIQDAMFGVAEELPPVWLVPDVLASGVWPRDAAIKTFRKLGFSEENAGVLADYGLSKAKTSKSETAQRLQGLSLGAAETLYQDQAIDKDKYTEILLAHGLGEDAATLTVELADIRAAQQARNEYSAFLVDQVSLGQLTTTDAVSKLFDNGFTAAEVDALLIKMQRAQSSNNKLPSKSDIDAMLKKGIIDQATWRQTMALLGYQEPWQTAYLELMGVSVA